MTTTLNIFHDGSLYEVAISGYIITRISQYIGGSQRRQDVEYDDLCEEVQRLIIDKVKEELKD